MRFALTLSAMAAGISLAAAGVAVAAPAPTAANAAQVNAGLQAMRDYNLIALRDLQSSSGVQGKTFVGGNLSGSSSNYMTKSGQAGVALTVAGNVTGSAKNVNNGGGVKIGGNLDSGLNANGGGTVYVDGNAKKINAGSGSVYVDGNVDQTNAGHIYYGGTISKNSNGVKHAGDHTAAGLQTTLEQAALDYTAELLATSDYLSDLSPTHTALMPNSQDILFDAGAGTGLAVFSISNIETLLKGRSNLKFAMPTSYDTLVVNVAGDKITLPGSINFNGPTGLGGKVIWNFYEASSVNFGSKSWYGSVLAPNAELKFNNFIEGSVVAKSLVQNGEIRLGGYSGDLMILNTASELRNAVPEPATWAMMILGFGVVGAAMRRQRAITA